jgi:hypothetical protein
MDHQSGAPFEGERERNKLGGRSLYPAAKKGSDGKTERELRGGVAARSDEEVVGNRATSNKADYTRPLFGRKKLRFDFFQISVSVLVNSAGTCFFSSR